MLRNHGSRARRFGAAVFSFIFGTGLAFAAGCALSPIGSESRRGTIDPHDAGEDDRDDDGDHDPIPPVVKRDGGGARPTTVRDASVPDGSTTSAISARDGGPNQATGPRDAAPPPLPTPPTPPTPPTTTPVDAGRVTDAGTDASDAGFPDTGVALLPAPVCQSAAQCAPETCPQLGSLPCCKADRSCGCRPILGVCR